MLKEIIIVSIIIVLGLVTPAWFSVNLISPDLLLVYFCFVSFRSAKVQKMVIFSFISGLIFDWLNGGILGLSSLYLSITTFGCALYSFKKEKIHKIEFVLMGLVIIFLAIYINYQIRFIHLSIDELFSSYLLPALLYNGLLFTTLVFSYNLEKKKKIA